MIHNTPEAVKQYYEEWTSRYMEVFGTYFQAQQTANPTDVMRNLTKVVPFWRGMKVLDAGCGVGGPVVTLAKLKRVNIEALTIADVQVEHAKANYAKASWLRGKVNFKQGDFHQLPELYGKEEFDLVYFMESLVHSHDPDTVLKGVRQVLKPKGYLYIKDLFIGPNNPENPRMTEFPVQAVNEQFCLKVQALGDMINLLIKNGFRIERCGVPDFKEDFTKGNLFTAKHLFKLREDRSGPWLDEGLIFLHWLEIVARKHY